MARLLVAQSFNPVQIQSRLLVEPTGVEIAQASIQLFVQQPLAEFDIRVPHAFAVDESYGFDHLERPLVEVGICAVVDGVLPEVAGFVEGQDEDVCDRANVEAGCDLVVGAEDFVGVCFGGHGEGVAAGYLGVVVDADGADDGFAEAVSYGAGADCEEFSFWWWW